MGISYNPSIVTEGLVLGLDPQSPRFYNYKGRSVAFDGTGDYLSIGLSSDFQLSNLDFTIEFWLNWTSFPGVIADLVSTRPNSSAAAGFLVYANSTHIVLALSSNGSTWDFNTGPSVTWSTGNWIHCSVTRQGSDIRFFINGTQQGSGYTYSNSINVSNPLVIGGSTDGYTLNGYISNLRILKGTALYTSNFTPPTEPLTAVTNTKLLTCQGNTISDASSSAHSITSNGNVVIDYNGPFSGSGWTDLTNSGNSGTLTNGPVFIPGGPFNNSGGSVYFDGTGGPTSTGSNLEFSSTITLGTGDFTVETWIYNTVASQRMEVWQNSSLIGAFALSTNFNASDGMNILTRSSPPGSGWSILLRADTELQHNSWNHIAWVRSGGTLTAYLNGVADGNISSSIDSSPLLTIGGWSTRTNYMFGGNLSNLRIIKGTALYTSNFTPPTKPLTAITNTVLLTCQGNSISDASSSGHTITANGNAAANLGFPASAFEFDGTDDYILLDSGLGIGTDDFAISVWVKFDSVSGVSGSANYRTVLSSYSGGNGYIFGLWISGDPVFEHYMEQTSYKGNTTIVADTWYNMVSTRLSGDLYLYLNGSLDNTPVSASTKDMEDTATPRIGWIPSASQNGRLDGTVSDLKVYKGKGLTAAEVEQNYNALKGRYA